MIRFLSCVACFWLLLTPLRAQPAPELSPEKAKALAEALVWLMLTDTGNYAEAFDACAPVLRENLDRAEWAAGLSRVRNSFGKMQARSLVTAFITETLPEAPPGNYLVLQFSTSFTLRPTEAKEIVVCTASGNGASWQVVGYYLEP